uniref:Uncharacterized protein n=1 Tax=Spongospora subterranea TaxID=70186 RepID=A0A0H5RB60_9EUKA|eukprot:CRZ11435.1 hypothetical protein [Spongospora subterranea]
MAGVTPVTNIELYISVHTPSNIEQQLNPKSNQGTFTEPRFETTLFLPLQCPKWHSEAIRFEITICSERFPIFVCNFGEFRGSFAAGDTFSCGFNEARMSVRKALERRLLMSILVTDCSGIIRRNRLATNLIDLLFILEQKENHLPIIVDAAAFSTINCSTGECKRGYAHSCEAEVRA